MRSWKFDEEIALLRAACYNRPVGKDRAKHLEALVKVLSDAGFAVTEKDASDKLAEYYDFKQLENLDLSDQSPNEDDIASRGASDDEEHNENDTDATGAGESEHILEREGTPRTRTRSTKIEKTLTPSTKGRKRMDNSDESDRSDRERSRTPINKGIGNRTRRRTPKERLRDQDDLDGSIRNSNDEDTRNNDSDLDDTDTPKRVTRASSRISRRTPRRDKDTTKDSKETTSKRRTRAR
ncbi:BA75_02272T0 [Komagataella pastoris]|uniref:BA75_02272T0 n=1 Tax=Komagataella pastoris TaxID=4922 RepID=A0A1B2JCR7_PICPA|nr:BA75_02272T0 [Komagataella pastoris]